MKALRFGGLWSFGRAVSRRLRLGYLWALARRLPPAVFSDFRLIAKYIRQDFHNRYGSEDMVLLARLRTVAHSLDKGLRCEPWQSGRGRAAYQSATAILREIRDRPRVVADPSYAWARDIVRQYEACQETGHRELAVHEPVPIPVEVRDALIDLIRSRRSARSFRRERIPQSLLEKIAVSVHWAPCSCCRQPVVLHITQRDDLVRDCLHLCEGATGFSGPVPCFVSVCADTRFYNLIDRHLPLVDASLGAHSFMLVAHAHGLACTALNWMHATRREEAALRRILGIPSHERIVFNIALGYPAVLPPSPGYKSVDQTCVFV